MYPATASICCVAPNAWLYESVFSLRKFVVAVRPRFAWPFTCEPCSVVRGKYVSRVRVRQVAAEARAELEAFSELVFAERVGQHARVAELVGDVGAIDTGFGMFVGCSTGAGIVLRPSACTSRSAGAPEGSGSSRCAAPTAPAPALSDPSVGTELLPTRLNVTVLARRNFSPMF